MAKAPKLGDMRWSIQLMRRAIVMPTSLGCEEIDHVYTPFLTTRAACQTHNGVSEFDTVALGGAKASHTFIIRFTSLPVDIRDRVQDSLGTLYTILAVDTINEGRRWMRLRCALVGAADKPVDR